MRGYFGPEFLNRIDEIIVFHSLTREDIRAIVRIQLDGVVRTAAAQRIDVQMTIRWSSTWWKLAINLNTEHANSSARSGLKRRRLPLPTRQKLRRTKKNEHAEYVVGPVRIASLVLVAAAR